MAPGKHLPWTSARRQVATPGKQDTVQSFASNTVVHAAVSSSANASPLPSQGVVRVSSAPGISRTDASPLPAQAVVRLSSAPGVSRTAARRMGAPGQIMGKSSSDARLKKGLGRLKPLPKSPITFEEMYTLAMQRAVQRSREERRKPTMASRSLSSGRSPQTPKSKLPQARKAWNAAHEGPAAPAGIPSELEVDFAIAEQAAAEALRHKSDQNLADDEEVGCHRAQTDPSKVSSEATPQDGPHRNSAPAFHSRMRSCKKQCVHVLDYLSRMRKTIDQVSQSPISQAGKISFISQSVSRSGSLSPKSGSMSPKLSPQSASKKEKPRFTSLIGPPKARLPAVFEGDSRLNLDSLKARQTGGLTGFDEQECERMANAFRRFTDESGEVHVDKLEALFAHLGYIRTQQEVVWRFAAEVSAYSTLDWNEFILVAEKFAKWEVMQFEEIFVRHDKDKDGLLDTSEVKDLFVSLGITPLQRVIKEAIEIVDLDASGQLDFDEFVYLMAVYRVTEGFTYEETELLLNVFECFSRRVGTIETSRQELETKQLGNALLHMFGPQSIDLARSLAKKYNLKFTEGCEALSVSPGHSIWTDGSRNSVGTESISISQSMSLDSFRRTAVRDLGLSEESGYSFSEFLVWARQMREAEIAEYRRQFDRFDADDTGKISIDELSNVIKALGYMPLRRVIKEVLEQVDNDSDEELDFDEFVNLMSIFRSTDGFCQYEMQEFTEVFTKYDQRDMGEVSCLELIDILRYLGYVTRLEDVRRYIKLVDYNGSGALDFREFIHLMRLHREAELLQVRQVFDSEKDLDTGDMPAKNVRKALRSCGYKLKDDEMAEMAITSADVENTAKLDFEGFVLMVDQARKVHVGSRRRCAGFSDEEINHFHKLFKDYDDDGNGYIERHELTNLLRDLHIPLQTVEDRQVLLDQLDQARTAALKCGVSQDLLGNFGDPKVTFYTLVHFIRNMHKVEDRGEVDRDMEATMQTNFTTKQVAEFRDIFTYWAHKSKEIETENQTIKAKKVDADTRTTSAEALRNRHGAIGSQEEFCEFLHMEGLHRVVRSLGLRLSHPDKQDLDRRFKQCKLDQQSRIDFPDFLRVMRWMLDTNFANINYAVGQSGDAF